MPSASWHIHSKGDYCVPLAFELRQYVSKTSLKYFFIFSLVFQKKDSVGKEIGGLSGLSCLFQTTNSEFWWHDPCARQMSWNESCPCSVARPKECGQCQLLSCLKGHFKVWGSALVSHPEDHPAKEPLVNCWRQSHH